MESDHPLRAIVVLYHSDDGALAMVRAIAREGLEPVVVANAIDPANGAACRDAR